MNQENNFTGRNVRPSFYHPGECWRLCYAAGGLTPLSPRLRLRAPAPGSTDRYFAVETAIYDYPNSPNPTWAAQAANAELLRESERHGDDVSQASVLNALRLLDSHYETKLLRSIEYLIGLGINPLFCTHRLNRFRPEFSSGERDPYGIVMVFPSLPARDRNIAYSSRRSCRRHESILTFVNDPDGVLTALEAKSVEEGFYLDLKGPRHSNVTRQKNDENGKRQEEQLADPVVQPQTDDDRRTFEVGGRQVHI